MPAMYMATQTVLFVSGRTTDSVTVTGDGVSHIVPIFESLALHRAILRLVGRDLAEYPVENLTEQGCSLTAAAEREFAWDITEKLCFIASDYDTVLTSTRGKRQGENLRATDGNITVSAERVRFADVAPAKFPSKPAESTTLLSVMKCDVATRRVVHHVPVDL